MWCVSTTCPPTVVTRRPVKSSNNQRLKSKQLPAYESDQTHELPEPLLKQPPNFVTSHVTPIRRTSHVTSVNQSNHSVITKTAKFLSLPRNSRFADLCKRKSSSINGKNSISTNHRATNHQTISVYHQMSSVLHRF